MNTPIEEEMEANVLADALAFLKIHEAIGDPDGKLSREDVVDRVGKLVAVLEVMIDLRNMAKGAKDK